MIEPDAPYRQWQLSKLKEQMGAVLFKRAERNRELTESKRMVQSRARRKWRL